MNRNVLIAWLSSVPHAAYLSWVLGQHARLREAG